NFPQQLFRTLRPARRQLDDGLIELQHIGFALVLREFFVDQLLGRLKMTEMKLVPNRRQPIDMRRAACEDERRNGKNATTENHDGNQRSTNISRLRFADRTSQTNDHPTP